MAGKHVGGANYRVTAPYPGSKENLWYEAGYSGRPNAPASDPVGQAAHAAGVSGAQEECADRGGPYVPNAVQAAGDLFYFNPGPLAVPTGVAPLTVAFWWNNDGGAGNFWSGEDDAAGTGNRQLRLDPTGPGGMQFLLRSAGTVGTLTVTGLSGWNHLMFSYNPGDRMRGVVDGGTPVDDDTLVGDFDWDAVVASSFLNRISGATTNINARFADMYLGEIYVPDPVGVFIDASNNPLNPAGFPAAPIRRIYTGNAAAWDAQLAAQGYLNAGPGVLTDTPFNP